jgi:hypothetical protein
MWPGLPTSESGAYVIETTVDEECAAHLVTKEGTAFGVYLDDTTPNLDAYVRKAVAKYGPLGKTVFVCVPVGMRWLHHGPRPPVVNLYEWYTIGMAAPQAAYGLPPRFEGYIVQRNWPGTVGKHAPTQTQYELLRAQVMAHHPKFVFDF